MDKNKIIKELMEKNFNLSNILHNANVAANFAGYATLGNDPGKVIWLLAESIAVLQEKIERGK